MPITLEDHIAIHKELHSKLDELIADFITQTGKMLNNSTIMELVSWSADQLVNPDTKEG